MLLWNELSKQKCSENVLRIIFKTYIYSVIYCLSCFASVPPALKNAYRLALFNFLGTVSILTPRMPIISLREQALWQLMPESCHCLNCTENHLIHYIVVCWKVKIILLPIILSMLYILVYSSHFKLFTLQNLVCYLLYDPVVSYFVIFA